jgi:hypothetical protein
LKHHPIGAGKTLDAQLAGNTQVDRVQGPQWVFAQAGQQNESTMHLVIIDRMRHQKSLSYIVLQGYEYLLFQGYGKLTGSAPPGKKAYAFLPELMY